MKLRPILRADAPAAAALLSEGFPVHSLARWQESIRLIFSHAGEGPIGQIATVGDRDVGIGLAIPGRRSAYEQEARDVVNLAAFYLRPGNEWLTAPFLRRIMKDPAVEYLDITASVPMREVNRRLGFTDCSRGLVVVPTAVAALRPGRGIRVMHWAEAPRSALSPAHREILAQHDRLNAIALAVERDGAFHPLILARSYHKRVGGARVVLARDRDLVRAVLGPVSRHLLGRGILFLEYDAMERPAIPEALFITAFAPVQSTLPSASSAIDLTSTELMFIPPAPARPRPGFATGRGGTALPFPIGFADIAVAAPAAACMAICVAEAVSV